MLKLKVKNSPELIYAAKIIFIEFLGLDIFIELEDNITDSELLLNNEKKIIFKDSFFSNNEYSARYLHKDNVPQKVNWLKSTFFDEKIPVIHGSSLIEIIDEGIICHADLFASAFFVLSRWEEAVSKEEDGHGRFPVSEALAYKEGFLNKPIVNQYTEIIWNMMIHLGYKGKRKERSFNIDLSHDVDAPYKFAFLSFLRGMRMLVMNVFNKRVVDGLKDFMNFLYVKAGNIKADPYNTFDFIMDVSDRMELKSTFFFIAQRTNRRYDGFYEIDSGKIKDLIRKINDRGHLIGLHCSYDSNKRNNIANEHSRLNKVCNTLDIDNIPDISRQHFLRWKTPESFQDLENAGIKFDATMTFADFPGFRTGSCYPHSVFNVKTREHLKLIEKPLVLMECSLLAKRYMNLSHDGALIKAIELKNECRKYSGTFSLLWHNNQFISKEMREIYLNILMDNGNE